MIRCPVFLCLYQRAEAKGNVLSCGSAFVLPLPRTCCWIFVCLLRASTLLIQLSCLTTCRCRYPWRPNEGQSSKTMCTYSFLQISWRDRYNTVQTTSYKLGSMNPPTPMHIHIDTVSEKPPSISHQAHHLPITPTPHLLLAPFSKKLPSTPATTAIPPTIATPTSPSFATFSSIRPFKLSA